jgi:DNA-binding transcriptional MerR regulator
MYKISEFARLSRVSPKMLRHYDELGLLRPVHIDPGTDYRYYSAEQLPQLNRIIVLKDLGFTLQQIARLLSDDLPAGQIKGMLKLRRAEVEQLLDAEQLRLSQIEARLLELEAADEAPRYDVVLRPITPQPVATASAVAYSDAAVAELLNEVEWHVARHHARGSQPPAVIYHGCETSVMQVEVAVPLSGAVPQQGRVRTGELPGAPLMACLVHVGAEEALEGAYASLLRWIAARRYRVAGPTRELYLRFAPEAPPHLPPSFVAARPNATVTEYQIPVVAV